MGRRKSTCNSVELFIRAAPKDGLDLTLAGEPTEYRDPEATGLPICWKISRSRCLACIELSDGDSGQGMADLLFRLVSIIGLIVFTVVVLGLKLGFIKDDPEYF